MLLIIVTVLAAAGDRSSAALRWLATPPRSGRRRSGSGLSTPRRTVSKFLHYPSHRPLARCRGDARLLHHRGRRAGLGAQRRPRWPTPTAFVDQVLGWRPGLPLVGARLRCSAASASSTRPGSPRGDRNATLSTTASTVRGTGAERARAAYLTGSAACCSSSRCVVAAAASLPAPPSCWAAPPSCSALVSTVLTLVDRARLLRARRDAGLRRRPGRVGQPRHRRLDGLRGALAVRRRRLPRASTRRSAPRPSRRPPPRSRPPSAAAVGRCDSGQARPPRPCSSSIVGWRCSTRRRRPSSGRQVLVSEIGIYVLLAIGLNVVVGWAGLLDLGLHRVLRHRLLHHRVPRRLAAGASRRLAALLAAAGRSRSRSRSA